MKKILLFTVLLGAVLLTLQGCAKDELDTTGSIAGVITDAETAKALSGATVTLSPSGKSFTTGVDGRYEFRDIAIGNYTVQATKAGYAENQKSVEVMAGETSSLDLPLRSSAPKLEVSTQTLDFGNTATTLTLDIRNTGSAELTWQVSEDIQWLNCVPTSGSTSAGKTSSVIVNVDRNGLSRGTYTQTIAIASNGGSETVKVTLSVQDNVVSVDVKPEALDFGSTTSSLQLTLTNTDTSRSIIAYALTASNDWIHLSKTQGQFTYSEVITVSVDRTALSEGTYSGQLSITIEGKKKVIPVTMTIAAKSKPTVSLTEISEVTYNSATFLGAIVSVGSSRVIHHGFVWATAEDPTVETAQKCDLGDLQNAKDFNYTATGLQSNTRYFVRVYAENSEGISYSSQLSVLIPSAPEAPTVQTGEISSTTPNQAQATGSIQNVGHEAGITQHGHVWDTQPEPTTAARHTSLGSTHAPCGFTSMLTALLPNTTYHCRAYATNAIGTRYGENITFTTPPDIVRLISTGATEITHSQATLGGSIIETGGNVITERGVCYGTSENPLITGNHQAAAETSNTFVVRVSDLTELTTYHARAYVCTETGDIYYGNDITFTTTYEIVLPSVSATIASKVTYRFASFSATVTSLGNGTLKRSGFCYSTAPNPTITTTILDCGTNTILCAYTSALTAQTTYHIRAFAENERGVAYGQELTIITPEKKGDEDELNREEWEDDHNWN